MLNPKILARNKKYQANLEQFMAIIADPKKAFSKRVTMMGPIPPDYQLIPTLGLNGIDTKGVYIYCFSMRPMLFPEIDHFLKSRDLWEQINEQVMDVHLHRDDQPAKVGYIPCGDQHKDMIGIVVCAEAVHSQMEAMFKMGGGGIY